MKEDRILGKIMLSIFTCIAIAIVGFVFGIGVIISGKPIFWQFFIAAAGLALMTFAVLRITHGGKARILRKIFICILAAFMVVGGGFAARQAYINSMPTVSDQGVDMEQYIPFKEDSKAVKLPEPSTLQLTDNLPILDGATALYPVYAAFAQAVYPKGDYGLYDMDTPVNYTNTVGAYERLIKGEADLIFVAQPSKEQQRMALSSGTELKLTPIGKEAFVFFVNAKNPVEELSLEQIQNIYAGKIRNWNEVGGKNEKIRPFQRPQDSGSQTMLEKLMEGKTLMKPEKDNMVDFMSGIIERTADYKNYKNAIGYSFRYYATEMVGDDQIKFVKVDGIEPTKETIRSGEYPITADVFAVTTAESGEKENVKKMLDWILSPQGQYIIEETGYVAEKTAFAYTESCGAGFC